MKRFLFSTILFLLAAASAHAELRRIEMTVFGMD